LQRGILDLDGGRWPEALAHFRRADALFPGWWLVEEHIAETMALLGDREGAERLYRGIVDRTGSPEFMDALALLLIARGETDEANTLRRRSRAIWGARLRQFPEASYGHALDHCAAFRDQACALQLAARNYAARPYGEAAEQYALVLIDAGRTAEARLMIDRLLSGPWRTARTFAVAAKIYSHAGDDGAAARFRAAALQLNPHIFG
jgi:tetratricopeptide (TPR) repeat protein